MFPRITEYVHQIMKERVKEGDICIDATMGNGLDTLYLARLVGEEGRVVSYDVQEQALERTRLLLEENRLLHRVELNQCSHQFMTQPSGNASCIVFNLGYLPGSDKRVTTCPETTIPAIERALELIHVGGLIIIVVYWGHEAGKKEKEEIEEFAESIPYPEFMVLKYQYVNPGNNPPFVLAIEKRKSKGR